MDALLVDVNVATASQIQQTTKEAGKLVDSFRYFHPHEARAYTVSDVAHPWVDLRAPLPNCLTDACVLLECWNTVTGARQTNYGTRIDYILVDPSLMDDSITDCMYVTLEHLTVDLFTGFVRFLCPCLPILTQHSA